MSSVDSTPPFLPPVLENIPQELRESPQWVAWIAVPNPKRGKPDKVPVNAKTGRPGSTTNPETWASFDVAAKFYQGKLGKLHTIWTRDGNKTGPIAGVGFVLTEDSPFVGIDIDHCIDSQGNIASFAQQIINRMGSYTEVSPSGTGIRIFVKGNMPTSGFKNTDVGLEVYKSKRYLTVTGRPLREFQIVENQGALDSLTSEYKSDAHKKKEPPLMKQKQTHPRKEPRNDIDQMEHISVLKDDSILHEKILASKNGDLFTQLYFEGDISNYPSQSEADLALCNILAFWTRKNPEWIDRLFRDSALHRPEKWDSVRVRGETYGEATIAKAIASTTAVYDPTDTSDSSDSEAIETKGNLFLPPPPPVPLKAFPPQVATLLKEASAAFTVPMQIQE